MDKPPAGSRLTKFTYKDQVVMRLKWLACGDHLLSSSESGHTTRDQFALIIRADEELLIRNDTASIDLLEMTNLNNNVACLIVSSDIPPHYFTQLIHSAESIARNHSRMTIVVVILWGSN